jgi:catechol 2,3-dioxygenase-like lactoylglutathione lyase family enzyme
MRFIPIFRVSDLPSAVKFYTEKLGFRAPRALAGPVVNLTLEKAELQLSTLPGDQSAATNTNLLVDDIEEFYRSVKYSGIDMASHRDSPVHQGVVEQTWGTLEFYVTDPDGNTIRFVQR